MKLTELKSGSIVLDLEPPEVYILAAACRVAGAYLLESIPVENPFAGLEHFETKGSLQRTVEGYGAMLEAAAIAADALFHTPLKETPLCDLSAWRAGRAEWLTSETREKGEAAR